MDYVLDETTSEYGQLMCDFFEILRGHIGSLPPDAVLSVQSLTVLTCLGKKYGLGSWIRMGDSSNPGLVGARIESMYCVNNELFMVLDIYPEMQRDADGVLYLPDASAPPKREAVPVHDITYLNGMWGVGRNAAGSGMSFVESPI